MNNTQNYMQHYPAQNESELAFPDQDVDITILDQDIWDLIDQYEAEHGHPLTKDVKSAMRGYIGTPTQPSRETTMNTYPSTPEASHPVDAVRQAYGEALFAAQSGQADVGTALDLNTQDKSYADYDRNAAELSVQARVIAQQDLPADPDFADLVGQAERDKRTFAIPMSEELRTYAQRVQSGQTTGAAARFGALAQSTTLEELAKMTEAAEVAGNHLERCMVNVRTARKEFTLVPRDSVDLEPYRRYLATMNQDDFGLGA